MKKLLSILMAIVLCSTLCCVTATAEQADDFLSYNGTCGENATWSYDTETQTLNIDGYGEMYSYENGFVHSFYGEPAPWASLAVKEINIADGITSIGIQAFEGCEIESIVLPDTITSIGNSAFGYCSSLTHITLPDSVTDIGHEALPGTVTVYYTGSESQWYNIDFHGYGSDLLNLSKVFNYGSDAAEDDLFHQTAEEMLAHDVNGDGSLDSLDAAWVLRYDALLTELDEAQLDAADINDDGEADNLDAALILKYDARLIYDLNSEYVGVWYCLDADAPDELKILSDGTCHIDDVITNWYMDGDVFKTDLSEHGGIITESVVIDNKLLCLYVYNEAEDETVQLLFLRAGTRSLSGEKRDELLDTWYGHNDGDDYYMRYYYYNFRENGGGRDIYTMTDHYPGDSFGFDWFVQGEYLVIIKSNDIAVAPYTYTEEDGYSKLCISFSTYIGIESELRSVFWGNPEPTWGGMY